MNTELIMRVREMERLFDAVTLAAEKKETNNPEITAMIRTLTYYTDSGLWLRDYEADERGEIPQEIRRGVLSQDGLYNLLENLNK